MYLSCSVLISYTVEISRYIARSGTHTGHNVAAYSSRIQMNTVCMLASLYMCREVCEMLYYRNHCGGYQYSTHTYMGVLGDLVGLKY